MPGNGMRSLSLNCSLDPAGKTAEQAQRRAAGADFSAARRKFSRIAPSGKL